MVFYFMVIWFGDDNWLVFVDFVVVYVADIDYVGEGGII